MKDSIQVASAKLAKKSAESDRPVWVQVAVEGTFKGYAGGELEFTFDRETFDQAVSNFRADPHYEAGPDGSGTEPVIAWDFNHASERDATQGSLPQSGAPAQGWVLDLEAREGDEGAELWALTQWLEPARTYIKEGRYNWASISIVFDAVDPITGERIGPLLTSIAATNTPFVPGLQKLAASRGAQQGNSMPPKIDLDRYEGRNAYEKALAYVRTQPWGKALSHESAFSRARDIVRENGEAKLCLKADGPGRSPVPLAAAVSRSLPSSPADTPDPDPDAEPVLDLRRAPGVNRYEKTMFVLGTELGESFVALSHEDKHRLAWTALRTREVVEQC